jgi:hypothetical protein
VTLYAQSRPARVDQRLSSRSLVQAIRRANLALRGYNPDQPRHPAGSPDGGRWRDDGRFDVAVNAPRPPRAGPWPNASPGQQARLAASRLQADAAVARVRERDPNWKPRPSIVEPTIEGEIARNEHVAREARARLETLQQGGIGPGPFAVESIPARNSSRNFTASERAEVDRIGRQYGCHTCGTFDPGGRSGRFFLDHQLPSALNPAGRSQRLFPHCQSYSAAQGANVRHLPESP